MPPIPRYQQSASPQQYPSLRLPEVAPAIARLGEGASDALQPLEKGLSEAIQQADQMAVLAKRRALNEWEYQNIYDPKKGAINRLGKNAFTVPAELSKSYDEFLKVQEAGLNGPQKAAFYKMAEARRDSVMDWANRHTAKQIEVFEEDEFKNGLESSKERGSLDLRHQGTELQYMRDRIFERGQKLGWGEEKMNQELREAEGDMKFRAVARMTAEGDWSGAESYVNRISDTVDPDVARKMVKLINDDRLAFQQASQIVERTGGKGAIPATLKKRLKTNQIKELEDRSSQLQQNIPERTNWKTFYQLKQEVIDDPKAFMDRDIMEFRSQLEDAEFKQLIELQQGLKKKDAKTIDNIKGLQTRAQVVTNVLKKIKVKPNPKPGSRDAERVYEFNRQLDRKIIEHKAATAKDATAEEIDKMASDLAAEVVVNRDPIILGDLSIPLPSKKRRAYEAGEQKPTIPNAVRKQITDALQKHNKPVTEAEIERLYRKWQQTHGK